MTVIYTKKHLLKALAEAGLPYSYKSLIKYEKLGVIPRETSHEVAGVSHDMRFYHEEDIENIVAKIKEYKKNNHDS